MSTPPSAAEDRILDAIDDEALVGQLVELVRVPSVTGTDAESELQHGHAAELTRLGYDVDLWRLDLGELAADPGFPGTEAPRTEGYGVVATTGATDPDEPPAPVLQGHVDVVPTGDLDR